MKSLIILCLSIVLCSSSCIEKHAHTTESWTEIIQQTYCPEYGSNQKWSGVSFAFRAKPIAWGTITASSSAKPVEWMLCYYFEFWTTGFFMDEERDDWVLFINTPLSMTEQQFFQDHNWWEWKYYEYEDALSGSSVLFIHSENWQSGGQPDLGVKVLLEEIFPD